LNYSKQEGALSGEDGSSPGDFRLRLPEGEDLAIPLRSKLLLQYAAELLNITIYVFSARKKSMCIKTTGATSSISFFHRIDSYFGTSEYLVIIPSPNIPFVNIPLPKSLPAYSSDTLAATFRQEMRPRQKRPLEDLSAVRPETCLRLYKRACIHKIDSDVESSIESIAKRTVFKKGDTKQSLLDQEKNRLLNKLRSCVKVPRGIMDNAVSSVKSEYGLSDKFTFMDLQKMLGDAKENVSIWKEAVESNFIRAWSDSIAGSTLGQPSAVTTDALALEVGDEDIELDGEEEVNGEEELDEKESIRTCTVTLKDILRPDLQDQQDRIISILNRNQTELTDVITELSVLTHKTVLSIAAGDFYGDNLGPQPSDGFDIRNILPDRFKFRCNVAPIIK
ncbi:hypothetical protein BGX27_004988, partial [Mortierella sp. AM989]